jgi:hypothetical protein
MVVLIMNLARVEELKSAIKLLSPEEFSYLWRWFSEQEWAVWDQQLARDSLSGKLDFLIEEALSERANNKLKAL